MAGNQPYADLNEDEAELRCTCKESPPHVDEIPCGNIIKGCWMCGFDSAANCAPTVYAAFRAEIDSIVHR